MSWFSRYVAYLKNNPEKYWFKAKLYGWGWTPATLKGWLVIGAFVAFVVWQAIVLGSAPELTKEALQLFFLRFALALLLVLLISYRTGEKPHWQWGLPQEREEEEREENKDEE